MVKKIITTGMKFIAGKAGETALKKISDTAEYVGDRIRFGVSPLNVGEDKLLDCYQQYPNNQEKCRDEYKKFLEDYHHPWRSRK